MIAVHGSNWRPLTSTPSDKTTAVAAKPPYSPRSSLLSPVKYGDQLQPFASNKLDSSSSYASYRLPSYTKDTLAEKVRQEAWVSRRINDLTREGLWWEKRLPKVCERPRPRTHWDGVLSEMQWLSVDFHEERQWKRSVAKILAYSAQKYVAELADRRARKEAAQQKRHRNISRFIATQIDTFWRGISNENHIHSDKKPVPRSNIEAEASSESGVCNLDDDEYEEETDEEFFDSEEAAGGSSSWDYFEDLDDESTIEEQESYEESSVNHAEEIATLLQDNLKSVDEVLESCYPGYHDLTITTTTTNDIDQHDSSISSADEEEEDVDDEEDEEDDYDSDLEEYISEDNILINLPLSGPQRKLYDDYLSSSQSLLDSQDAASIASVLQTLRKICNHPQLLQNNPHDHVPEHTPLAFARVMDGVALPTLASKATNYDPLARIDLASLNLVFFTHESTLTALTSDRIRKCCAPKSLIEEVPPSSPQPKVPLYKFSFGSEGWSMDQGVKVSQNKSGSSSSGKTKPSESKAFHADSLNVIAKFNERRCNGMPLYGQDLIQVLTIVSPDAICSPPRMSQSSVWKGTSFIQSQQSPPVHNVESDLFWPFCTAKPRNLSRRHLRLRMLKNVSIQEDLSSIHLPIHSDMKLPPKVQLVAGFNRTHLALTSKHLAVEEAVKFARLKQQPQFAKLCNLRRTKDDRLLFEISAENLKMRQLSSKLAKVDGLLREFRARGERALIFCEMPEMLELLARFLQAHHVPFVYLDPHANIKQRLTILEDFTTRPNFLALLTTPRAASLHGQANLNPRRFNGFTDISNVVFFDSNLMDDQAETLEWCRSFNGIHHLRVYKLVCENTVEDSLGLKALQQKLAMGNSFSNGPICKIKKHALEAVFNPCFGDNGILAENKVGKTSAMDEILEDPEIIAQLDWLWSNNLGAHSEAANVVELSQQVDKGCVNEELKPIARYAKDILLPRIGLSHHQFKLFIDVDEIFTAKMEWEEAYQSELALLASELDDLERIEPQLTYCREDASRSWHGLDGQPMPLWTPPIPLSSSIVENSKLRVDEHLSYLYEITLMEESDLPPVYVKKELLKRSASEAANELDKHKMMRKEDGYVSAHGGAYAPRSLFDRHPHFQKQKLKAAQKRLPMGSGSYVHGPLPANFQQQNAIAGLRHPIPRQQVEAENQPEWLIQEDWALLQTIKDVQGLPLSLNTMSPAHTVNWDLVSDMVNAVSRVYRGPRQCKHRFDTIIAPREEGRILYDMPPTSSLASASAGGANAAAANNKKNKKNKPNSLKFPSAPGKANKPMKTSQIFHLDKNNSWSSLFATRFETIKAVANKRSPTNKPLVFNAKEQKNNKHAAVLADCGISYEAPLNPIQVAANRAERIQKEKQKTAADQAAQLNQQRVAAAQAAANAAQQSAAATARVAIVQQPQQQNQTQQAVVVGIPAGQGQVRQVISQQSVQELVRSQQQNVVTSQQPTVVVTSHPPVVSVGNLTASQLAQTLVKQAKPVSASPVTSVAAATINQSRLTPQQFKILQQQAALKKSNEKRLVQGLPTVSTAVVTAATTAAGQKVSIAVTPSGVTLATLANSMPVTVVTQALGGGQQRAQLIQRIPGGKGNIRMTESDMKLLLASKQQQLQAQQQQKVVTSQQQTVTQLLQGIQSGAQQVTTLVKSQAGASTSQAVTIPVQMQNVQGIKTIRQGQQPTMVQLRHQLLQGGPRSKIIPQGGQTILATSQQGQKVALSQVAAAAAASGAKGMPAQLIVSSGGNSQKPVTVQQIHQIKGPGGQGQQLIPQHLLKAQGQGQATVQARVIPATVAGRPQQIHVVAAPASATSATAQVASRQSGGAPNVTVDASGRPTAGSTTALQAGQQIRVAASQSQLLNQFIGVRTTPVITQATGPNQTKLQVVHASSPAAAAAAAAAASTAQNQQQNNDQQNG